MTSSWLPGVNYVGGSSNLIVAGLKGLEGPWPELARLNGDQLALEAPHSRPPQKLSYREQHVAIERTAAAFAALGLQADKGILQVCRRMIALHYLDAQDGRARQIACRIQ